MNWMLCSLLHTAMLRVRICPCSHPCMNQVKADSYRGSMKSCPHRIWPQEGARMWPSELYNYLSRYSVRANPFSLSQMILAAAPPQTTEVGTAVGSMWMPCSHNRFRSKFPHFDEGHTFESALHPVG